MRAVNSTSIEKGTVHTICRLHSIIVILLAIANTIWGRKASLRELQITL